MKQELFAFDKANVSCFFCGIKDIVCEAKTSLEIKRNEQMSFRLI